VTKETAVFIKSLKNLGADVSLCASNPLSTQDDVAAYLASIGVNVFAWRGETDEEYLSMIEKVIESKPDIAIDDGGDLHVMLHEREELQVIGGTEETTTGVIRLKALERARKLLYPIIAVNNAKTKRIFDNKYGTGQSTIDGIMRATSLLLAGKKVVVCGYGWVGRGIAKRAKGMGAHVIVTEVDPIKALEALFDGFDVMPMQKAAKVGDVFITATGQINVIRREHMLKMKNGAILANSGHFNVEISLRDLEEISVKKRRIKNHVDEYTLKNGRKLFLLGEGRLINLVAAEGHPPEVMTCSFSNQLLSVIYILRNHEKMDKKVYDVPENIDEEVAASVLKSWNIELDQLTEEQRKYAESWRW
ncbi:adenosylhomocysteinase, partial [Candidatus Geothermarchaeota archaeon]